MNDCVKPADAVLVRRVLAGDVDLYGVLVERYRNELARYATALCGDPDTAADAMQEAFIRAFDSLGSCRDPGKFKAWFFRILTNQCHSVRNRRPHVPLERAEVAAGELTDEPLERLELRRAIEEALDSLTDEQREAFVMKHVEGRSYAEMADLLETGEDALKMRVYRARDELRKRLEHLRGSARSI
ncbi:MAG: RNA polymerase sigma factor [Gemmatimonadetes bacterium]|nr:RNA polymerase sigma factor [Gemmatimonadota bacterium]